jgi:hypothetical protein
MYSSCPQRRLERVVRAEGGFSVSVPGSLGGVEKGLIVSGPAPVGDAVQGFALQDRPFSPQLSKGVQPKTEYPQEHSAGFARRNIVPGASELHHR